ncbi:tRNA (adenosine(37)-N6)-threonylcarbamoyltransferase complex ATPase subunit type 1 TsaE [Clostridium thailandense]|uniref:tRNA (adenosine(37)-N6)-threonylcarbamoyltransferase complex ATPase subunit type 1 TsaE n=1 Tax=Clostridium thailandense TaxID=2794346 RepID=UPI0039893501
MEFITNNADSTMKLGRKLGHFLKSGDIVCITGDLGAGKTHFTKGVAEGLDIKDPITSPTFTIVNEYEGRLKLNHFDVYRVSDPDEIEAIGFDEYIFSNAVTIIEWANFIEELIPKEHIWINIKRSPEFGNDYRKIFIEYYGDRYNYIKELK